MMDMKVRNYKYALSQWSAGIPHKHWPGCNPKSCSETDPIDDDECRFIEEYRV